MHGTVLSEIRTDVFSTVTAKIVSAIEAGAGSFNMPWHGGILPPTFPVNASTDNPYRGINVLNLWIEATARRYISAYLGKLSPMATTRCASPQGRTRFPHRLLQRPRAPGGRR